MAGIYIHIPFCKSRCKYCDFFSTTLLDKQEQYIDALLTEWQDRQHEIAEPIETIYIGGGTPSVLGDEAMRRLGNEAMRRLGDEARRRLGEEVMKRGVEVTMEANPGDITQEKAKAWRAMGINRLSIGVQSFDDTLLQLIGRRHTAAEAKQAITIAQAAGFDNISIDLMYALPSQTLQQWQNDVAQALQMGVQHISTYGLIYEEGTRITQLLQEGEIEMVDEEIEMQMYDYLVEQLTANGFIHYEVSNFALLGRESKHNSSYWNGTPYIGLGAGAHSYNGTQRQWNISHIDRYIEQALSHNLQPEIEILSAEQKHMEEVMLGLRTNHGVNQTLVNMSAAQPYIQKGLLTLSNGHVIATTQGFHILNRIIEDIL